MDTGRAISENRTILEPAGRLVGLPSRISSKRNRADSPMRILSHRGLRIDHPENTVGAFEAAWRLGVDGFETDVRLSADGVPVLFHDRVAPGGREVASLTWAELRDDCGFDVPRLEDVLARWPEAFWNLEIKVPEALDALESAIRRLSRFDRLLISSFWHPVVLASSRRIATSHGLIVAHRPFALGGLLAGLPVGNQVKTIVWDFSTFEPALLGDAARLGLSSFVYGPVTPSEHDWLRQLGVDGLITDYPDLALATARPAA